MPEHENLKLLRALRSAQQHDQLQQPAQSQTNDQTTHNLRRWGRAKLSIHQLTPLSDREPSF
jgi:hypothetical protein